MIAALALAAYLIQPGDTLSGIAASHGVSLAAVEAANPQFSNPNLIYAGQRIEIPRGSSPAKWSYVPLSDRALDSGNRGTATRRSAPSRVAKTVIQSAHGWSGYSSSSLSDVPGVPRWFAACVAYRESTDLRNPAAGGNAYGIISASGYDVQGTSLAYQKRVFAELYRDYGGTPWVSDGCPGT